MARTTIGSLGILSGNILKLAMKKDSYDVKEDEKTNQIIMNLSIRQEEVLLEVLKERESIRKAYLLNSEI